MNFSSSLTKRFRISLILASIVVIFLITEPSDSEVILLDRSWEHGSIQIKAKAPTTLWLQITDDRPDHQYENLGSPWNISLYFGELRTYKTPGGGVMYGHPYRLSLYSLAFRAMAIDEYEKGNTPDYYKPSFAMNLDFEQIAEDKNGSWEVVNSESIDLLSIEREGSTYTAVFTLPEWFDVSVYDDFTSARITLAKPDYYLKLWGEGFVNLDELNQLHFYRKL